MSLSPVSFIAVNYRDFKNYWLKFYEPGTVTPKTISLDAAGSVTVAKLEINKDGFLESAGGGLVIAYVDGSYDAWIFPTEAEADSNDTSSALRLADDITGVRGTGNNVEIFTLADAVANTSAIEGDIVQITDRADVQFSYETGQTPNTWNIVAADASGLDLVMRDANNQSLIAWGAIGNGVADDIAVMQVRADAGGTMLGNNGDTYLISTTLTISVANTVFDLRKARIKQHATWSSGTELVLVTSESSGVINGSVQGNSDLTDETTGIQGDFSVLVPESKSYFSNLLLFDLGESGLKILAGKNDKVDTIWCTNNHISTNSSQSGNIRFDSCEDTQSSNVTIWESFGKGMMWSICKRCTHSGLIVDRATFVLPASGGNTGVSTVFSDDITISNVYCRNVNNKFSQFSNNIKLSNFKLLNTGDEAFRLQGASNCNLSHGEIDGSAPVGSRTVIMNQHPSTGSGTSDSNANVFSDVKITATVDGAISMSSDCSANKFLNCEFTANAASISGVADAYVVVDNGIGNSFKECNISSTSSALWGGFTQAGASWKHTDVIVNVPAESLKNAAAGSIIGGEYISLDGGTNGITANAAIEIRGSSILVDGSTVAVPSIRLNAPGNRLSHSRFKTVTDTTSGYGILFGGAAVEDTQITHCDTSGGNRSIKSVTQSTTNKLSFITIEGGGIDNGVNGTNDPGAHKAEFIGT